MSSSEQDPAPKPGRRIHGLDAEERKLQRRAQLLDSALTTFAERGYANTSVEQVCQGASVSTKSFYRIFENREDLYLAVYQRFMERVSKQVGAAMADQPGEEHQAEELLLDTLITAYFDDAREALVLQGPARAVTPTIERVRRDARRGAAEYLESVWKNFGLTGDYAGLAVAVIGGIFDLFTTALVDDRALSEEELLELRAEVKRFYQAVRAGLSTAF